MWDVSDADCKSARRTVGSETFADGKEEGDGESHEGKENRVSHALRDCGELIPP